MNLYVQAHSKVVLILLAEEGLSNDCYSIKALVSVGHGDVMRKSTGIIGPLLSQIFSFLVSYIISFSLMRHTD